jgi:4-hydroxy-tetrahydrodipicolinate reductase
VEVDAAKVGRPIRDLLGATGNGSTVPRGLRVAGSLADAMRGSGAEIVLHTTQSTLRSVFDQIRECVERGLPVVSSTEELSMPFVTEPDLSERLDRIARQSGVAVLGTGVNPGFVMDLLPIVAAATCLNVRRIRIERALDAGLRRASFQKKVGVGMPPAEARRRLREGSFGHAGLLQSALLVAAGCGLHPDTIRQSARPVLASKPMRSALGPVKRGQVAGLRQKLIGARSGKEILSLEVVMALGVVDPHDAALIDADPPVHLRLVGGLHGDHATVGALVNAIPRVLGAAAGLRTLLDLPLPRPFATGRWEPRLVESHEER